jgi:hypothetical protein
MVQVGPKSLAQDTAKTMLGGHSGQSTVRFAVAFKATAI